MCAKPAKDSRMTVRRDRATDVTGDDAASMSTDRAVRVGLEFDELPFLPLLDKERAATIVRIAFGVTNLQHFVERDGGLARRS